MKRKLILLLFFMISQLHSQVDKDSLKINEKKVYNIISKDSLEKIQTLPVLPYSYNKSISDNDNIDKILSNLYASIFISNNKIRMYYADRGTARVVITSDGKIELKDLYSRRNAFKSYINEISSLYTKHFDYLDSIGKKIIPAKSLTLNKNLDGVYLIPISYKMETYEDKYNRNELILRGPMFSNLSEIPVENFVSNYMSFNNKIYEILDLDKIFDSKRQIKLLLRVSIDGTIFIEDARSNDKNIVGSFENNVKKLNDWIKNEKQSNKMFFPAINIYNEEVDYFFDFSNFTLIADE